jgi:hypothetical protein
MWSALFLAFALLTRGQTLAISRIVMKDYGRSNGRNTLFVQFIFYAVVDGEYLPHECTDWCKTFCAAFPLACGLNVFQCIIDCDGA